LIEKQNIKKLEKLAEESLDKDGKAYQLVRDLIE
jgi:hypothetical protein